VASKSDEQQLTESPDGGKLVPYEDDVSDDSETEKEAVETVENINVTTEKSNIHDEGCTDNCAIGSLLNGDSNDVVNKNNTVKLNKPAEPTVTSFTVNHVPGCIEKLSSSGDNNSDTRILSESSSELMSVPEVKSTAAKKEATSLLSGMAADGLAALADGDMGCVTKLDADDDAADQLKNSHLSSDGNAVSHSVAGRKRHARHKSKRQHTKRQHCHATQTSTSDWYGDDEEVEYVWVEKTAKTIAQELTGKCHLSSVLCVTMAILASLFEDRV